MYSKDMLGKKVVSVRSGKKMGLVRRPVIDADNQKVIGFIVDDREWFLETKILLFQSIRGMAEDIITVDDESSLTPVRDLPRLHDILIRNVQLADMKMISESGKDLGFIDDFSFNPQTGKIETYQGKDNPLSLDGRDVLSLGEEMIIVKEEYSVGVFSRSDKGCSEFDLSSLFERRQVEFLLGKTLIRDIYNDRGEVLIPAGSVIDSPMIMRIKGAGKFNELLMSADSEE